MADLTHHRARGWLPVLVTVVVVLMAVVVAASAWLRLAQSQTGLACSAWPECRDAAAPNAARLALLPTPADSRVAQVRGVHRVAATSVLLLAVALVVALRRVQPVRRDWQALAYALLALGLGLSVLGVVTPGSRSVAVLLGNQLGGLLMLALALALLVRMITMQTVTDTLARRARWVGALWLLQSAAGALTGSGQLALAPVAHLGLAVLTVPMALVLGWQALIHNGRSVRFLGGTLCLLALLQYVLGANAAANAAPMQWVLLHNSGAAWGLAVLGGLVALRRQTSAAAAL